MRNAAIRIACLLLAFSTISTFGYSHPTPTPIYRTFELDQLPTFDENGMDLGTFLQEALVYPIQAREEAIEGKVFIEFIVAPDGQIENPTVVRGIGYGCDEEVLRVFEQMAAWKPGIKQNRPVPTRIVLPITFDLE
ncbi:MAG: energy transducer TonB [Saprospiraceae bacterium]|nr:energy transducer TonB [Saprospiraceae bacterium]